MTDTPTQPAPGRGAPDLDLFGHTPKGRPDWSHRRGEPRLFAILWMVYLMAASGVMLAGVAAANAISPSVTRPAATAMLIAAMIGVTVLWPMVRLSQAAPERPVRAVAGDLLVMLPPAYALVLPQAFWFLSSWPIGVVLAIGGAFTAWGVLVGGVLAVALLAVRRGGRTAWMLVFLAITLGAPVLLGAGIVGSATAPNAGPTPGWMGSPITAVLEIARPRVATGQSARVWAGHWRLLGATAAIGGIAWVLAGVGQGFARGARDA